jgi:hypothetical protein
MDLWEIENDYFSCCIKCFAALMRPAALYAGPVYAAAAFPPAASNKRLKRLKKAYEKKRDTFLKR